jgi:tRNA-binding protein
MQVMAVVNFEPRNIAGFMSEVLVLGAEDAEGNVVVLTPSREVVVGGRMH